MKEALFISGTIFFHAAWTTDSKRDIDLVLAMTAALICWGLSILMWIAP